MGALHAAFERADEIRAIAAVHGARNLRVVGSVWMDKCPVLGELRARTAFAELRRVVRARADKIWEATTAT